MLLAELEQYSGQLPDTSTSERQQYERHFELLKKWNASAGLVSRDELIDPVDRHYFDSLFISDFVNQMNFEGTHWDLGSGGGFPGLCFAIRYPHRKVVLCELDSRKRAFLTVAKNELKLINVTVQETMESSTVDRMVTARAVYQKETLFEKMQGWLSPNSLFVVNYTENESVETFLNASLLKQATYTLPKKNIKRTVACFTWNKRFSTENGCVKK